MFRFAFSFLMEHDDTEVYKLISHVLFNKNPMKIGSYNNVESVYGPISIDIAKEIAKYFADDEIQYPELITNINDTFEKNFGEYMNRTELKQLFDEIACHICFYYGTTLTEEK